MNDVISISKSTGIADTFSEQEGNKVSSLKPRASEPMAQSQLYFFPQPQKEYGFTSGREDRLLQIIESLASRFTALMNQAMQLIEKLVIERANSANSLAQGTDGVGSGVSLQESQADQDFLWKPVSERDGNAVALLPAKFTGQVVSVKIVNREGVVVAEGARSGIANGGREHFRFKVAGEKIPPRSKVVVELLSGEKRGITIQKPSERYTLKGGGLRIIKSVA